MKTNTATKLKTPLLSERQQKYRNDLLRQIHCSDRWEDFYAAHRNVYEEMLWKAFRVRSAADLSIDSLILLNEFFSCRLTVNEFWQKTKPERKQTAGRKQTAAAGRKQTAAAGRKQTAAAAGNVIEFPTGKQLWLCEHLKGKIEWRETDGFSRWCKKYFGFDRPKTKAQFTKVITALKNYERTDKNENAEGSFPAKT